MCTMWGINLSAFFLLPIYLIYRQFYRRPSDAPPGPIGVPVLGVAMQFGKDTGQTCYDWSLEYGPIFSARMGFSDIVVLNDYDSLREALVDQKKKFSGRPQSSFLDIINDNGYGIGFVDYGKFFKQQKPLGEKALYGLQLDRKMNEELPHLLEDVRKLSNGKAYDITESLSHAMIHLFCNIMLGQRLKTEDPRFQKLHAYFSVVFANEELSGMLAIGVFMPFLLNLRYFSKQAENQKQRKEVVMDVIGEFVSEELKDEDDQREPTDFIAATTKGEIEAEHDKTFTRRQVTQFTYDCFFAGVEGTYQAIRWAIIVLIRFPEMQTRLREEIKRVFGDEEFSAESPKLNPEELPFTFAFMQELFRFRTIVPTAVPHKTTEDVEIRGMKVANNTVVIANLWAIHSNPKYWEDPDKFDPGRHLDSEGRFQPSDHVIPFSIGPRSCLGRFLFPKIVRNFLVAMVTRFEFGADPLGEVPRLKPKLNGAVIYAFPFDCVTTDV